MSVLQSSLEVYIFIFFSFLVSSLILRNGIMSFKRSNVVKNTGTEKIRSMSIGRTELKGEVVPINTKDIPFLQDECVRAEWEIEEYRSGPNSDSKSWETIAKGSYGVPFFLHDGTGKAYIDTNNEDIMWEYSSKSTQTWSSHLIYRFLYKMLSGFEKYPKKQIEDFEKTNNLGSPSIFKPRRYKQKFIGVGENIYVLGETKHKDNVEGQDNHEEYKIGQIEQSKEFIVSGKNEEQLKKDLKSKSIKYILGSALMFILSIYISLVGF